jgi:hypothetical protein
MWKWFWTLTGVGLVHVLMSYALIWLAARFIKTVVMNGMMKCCPIPIHSIISRILRSSDHVQGGAVVYDLCYNSSARWSIWVNPWQPYVNNYQVLHTYVTVYSMTLYQFDIKSKLYVTKIACYDLVQNLIFPFPIYKHKDWNTSIRNCKFTRFIWVWSSVSLSLWQEHRLKLFENGAEENIRTQEREEITGGWRI